MAPPTRPYRVALMARVSTVKQGERPMSLPQQYEECRAYAAERGWEIVEELEDRVTGMTKNRQGILQAIALAEQGVIDGVLALNHDRLCRSKDVRGWFKTELKEYGARIHYTREPDEPDSLEGKFSSGMLDEAAEYVRNKAVEGLTNGRVARVVRDGKILHNGTAPYGYDFNADRSSYVENAAEAIWVKAIFERYADGQSPRAIADWLNTESGVPKPRRADQWSRPVVYGILHREDYTGTGKRLGWELPEDEYGRPLASRKVKNPEQAVKMAFPQLAPPELWQRSLAMREEASHHTSYGKTDPDAALFIGTGRVVCMSCSQPMSFESQAKAKNRRMKGLYRCRRKGCPNPASYRSALVDEMAKDVLRDVVMGEEWFEARYEAAGEAGGEMDQEINQATKAVADLEQQRKNLRGQLSKLASDDVLLGETQDSLCTVVAQLQAAKEMEASLLRQRAEAKHLAERARDYGKWLSQHRDGFEYLTVPGLRRLASLIDLKLRVRRRPGGTDVSVTGGVRYDLSDSPFPDLTEIVGREPNQGALERVAFDASPRSHSNQHGHRSGRAAGEPMYRPSPGTPHSHRRWE